MNNDYQNYNPDIQICAMRCLYPQFKVKRRGVFDIEFIGDLQVKPTFPVYTISITYQGDRSPLVRVLNPKLPEKLPHFYKKTQSLCLYHPKNFRWIKEKLIAKNIVSWTATWIYFYEVWLRRGKWYGPEASHGDLSSLETN